MRLTVFHQRIANALFQAPGPRAFYLKVTIKPPFLATLETARANIKLAELQDFRLVNLEEFHADEPYMQLARTVAHRQLELSKSRLGARELRTDPADLLAAPEVSDSYAGLDNLIRLSHRNVYSFLGLLEKAIAYSDRATLLAGGYVSIEAQTKSARSMASIVFSGISPRVTDESDAIKHLVNVVLRRLKEEHKGPFLTFERARVTQEGELVARAISESIFKLCLEESTHISGPADWVVELNRMLLPKEDIDLQKRPDLIIREDELTGIIQAAERKYRNSRKNDSSQQELFSAKSYAAVFDTTGHQEFEDFKRFVGQKQTAADEIIDRYKYAQGVIAAACEALPKEIYRAHGNTANVDNITVALAGSFARGEAQVNISDADVFVVIDSPQQLVLGQDILKIACDWFRGQGFKVTPRSDILDAQMERHHPFPFVADMKSLIRFSNTAEDSEEDLTRRMCLLLESVPLLSPGIFEHFRQTLFESLDAQQYLEAHSLPVTLLRAFDGWCNSFRSRIERYNREGLARHRRLLQVAFCQHATLLGSIAHASTGTNESFLTLLDIFRLPPFLRMFHIHNRMGRRKNDMATRVAHTLRAYNDFMAAATSLSRTGLPNLEEVMQSRLNECVEQLNGLNDAVVGTLSGNILRDYRTIKAAN